MRRFALSIIGIFAASAGGHGVFGTPSCGASDSSAVSSDAAFMPSTLIPRHSLSPQHLLAASSASEDASLGLNNADRQEDASSALDRRTLLNYMLVSTAAGGTATILSPPPQPANAFPFGPSTTSPEGPKPTEALDRAGQPIIASQFLASKSGSERTMIAGLKSDPTYLIVTLEGGGLEPYALNAECTHLGCLVPWDPILKKFECPCHGSQYDSRGAVLRGPAPGPLKLAKVSTDEESGKILLENWTDEDFRTGEKPWWV